MRSQLYRLFLIPIGAAVVIAAPGRADIRYTTEMAIGDTATAGQAADKSSNQAAARGMMPAIRTTTFVKDNNERQETLMQMGGMQMKTVNLTLCGKKQTVKMDPDLKIYTITPIGATSFGPPATGMGGPGAMGNRPARKAEKPGVGKVVTTFTVQDMGREKLLNLDTRHAMLTIRNQSSGCAGDSDTTMKMEVWMAPIKTLNCPDRFSGGSTGSTGGPTGDGGCKITYEMKGDVEKMKDIFSGMAVQQKFYQNDKVMMVQTLREHSMAALDDSLFTVPADYKLLPEEEFNKAQQEAMQKAMMRAFTSGAKAAADQAAQQSAEQAAENAKNNAEAGVEAKANDAAADAPKPDKPKKKKIRIPGLPF